MARRFLTSDDTAPPPATDGTPPAPHMQWNLHGSAAKAAVAGSVIVAVLFFAAIVWRIFFSGRGQDDDAVARQARGAGGGAAVGASSSAASTPGASPRAGRGLREDDLLALPVYVHGSSPDPEEGGEGKVECAVCIGELRDGDTGRILPRCGHRFHAECVGQVVPVARHLPALPRRRGGRRLRRIMPQDIMQLGG